MSIEQFDRECFLGCGLGAVALLASHNESNVHASTRYYTIRRTWLMGIFTSNPLFEMLKKDHAKVKEMFDQFEKATDKRTRARLVQETLLELDVHATLEEQLIY